MGKYLMNTPIIEITGVQNELGGQLIHKDINLTIHQHDIVGIIGASGCGKTTLLRNILMLSKPLAGTINVFGIDILHCSATEANIIRQRWGVMFQRNALFSSLTVLENVLFPLREFTQISLKMQREIALLKINMVGLPLSAANKYPSQLSGGMQKRAAAARAIAMDPELLFLDEPTAGLDQHSAYEFDQLILHLRDTMNLTVLVISHELKSLERITDKIAFMAEGKILAYEPFDQIIENPEPIIQDYFVL